VNNTKERTEDDRLRITTGSQPRVVDAADRCVNNHVYSAVSITQRPALLQNR